VPESLAREISESVAIPTIGIGAGRFTDGQVLVINDLLGLSEGFKPKFLKKYANLFELAKNAVAEYDREVKGKIFPSQEHSYE